jgi:hypothetical protein
MATCESQINPGLSSREAISKDIHGHEIQDWWLEEMNSLKPRRRWIKSLTVLPIPCQTCGMDCDVHKSKIMTHNDGNYNRYRCEKVSW